MPRSRNVNLPEDMVAFVDSRTDQEKAFATPSDYVRDLIRRDMESQTERLYVLGELLRSMDDIKHGRLISGEDFEAETKRFVEEM
jgi:antitoxin ParD1/3/4